MPRWLVFTALTMVLWGGWGLVSKPLSSSVSAWQIQTLSFLGELPVILVLLRSRNFYAGTHHRRALGLSFVSGLIGSLGNVAYYQALAIGGKAAAVTPLTALYPVVTILLAIGWLGERLNGIQALGIAATLVALGCFNFGDTGGWLTPWLAFALVPIALWGMAALLQKVATETGSSELVTAGFLAGALPVCLFTPWFAEFTWRLAAGTWALLIGLGLLYALGNLTLIKAYGTGGKAAIVTPLAALYSLVTIPLAVLILGERIGPREGVGILLALAAAVALAWETQKKAHV